MFISYVVGKIFDRPEIYITIECLPNMHEILGLIPALQNRYQPHFQFLCLQGSPCLDTWFKYQVSQSVSFHQCHFIPFCCDKICQQKLFRGERFYLSYNSTIELGCGSTQSFPSASTELMCVGTRLIFTAFRILCLGMVSPTVGLLSPQLSNKDITPWTCPQASTNLESF